MSLLRFHHKLLTALWRMYRLPSLSRPVQVRLSCRRLQAVRKLSLLRLLCRTRYMGTVRRFLRHLFLPYLRCFPHQQSRCTRHQTMLSAYSTSQRLCRKDHNQMDRPLPLCNHNLLHFPDLKRHPHNVSHNICNLHKFPLRKSHSYTLSVLRSHPHTDNRQNSVQPEIWMHLLQTYLPFFRMGLPVRSECMEWTRLRCRKALL